MKKMELANQENVIGGFDQSDVGCGLAILGIAFLAGTGPLGLAVGAASLVASCMA
ncbi:hypothetical protein GVN16_16015 [Emticicia sp. CRIBPO]|uniref:hypothetical protein n=1 Tax=Emticicia sp. CRIBPO TaxID=2683258 RepID=UPI0014130894|nr:hypothetical protein [Emticicia sp. CRIBPO]NBA87280.1 hypothetical protein [Emticicia sp. CRIBPO]